MFNNIFLKNASLSDKINWLRLVRTRGISRSTLFNLAEIFDNIQDIIDNVGEYSVKGGLKQPIEIYPFDLAQKEFELCQKNGAQIICYFEDSYPELLRQISDPPPILTIRGKGELLQKNIIAIVGPRNASLNGCQFAKKVAYELSSKGIVIASGMAIGIDRSAHKASIENGTIGVIAGGIDNIYPMQNLDLYQEIYKKGLLISEHQIGSAPRGGNFPQRNRIISGISLGVVVVEATLKSGTLITARFALEQNREIFAVPGSPFDPRHEGTNRLIKQGAKLIQNSDDILEDINDIIATRQRFSNISESLDIEFMPAKFKAPDESIVGKVRDLILSKISYSPTSIELIVNELEIPAKIANIACAQLELADKIENKNGKISLKKVNI